MLYLIGIGLNDEKDITIRGLEAIKQANKVYLETYTSINQTTINNLEAYFEQTIIPVTRKAVEEDIALILEEAKKEDIALLIIGDVYAATTHTEIWQEAKEMGVPFKAIHNTSIMNAITETGLDLYKFGRTTTLCYPEKNYSPNSFYDVIEENKKRGLHTLCLLDIKKDEERYMTVHEAIQLLLEIGKEKQGSIQEDTLMVGCARITADDQTIISGTAKELLKKDFGKPPHSLVVPGKLHVVEEEALNKQK